jgi:hypothetical protein
MAVREHAREWIEKRPAGPFEVAHIYSFIENTYPHECDSDTLTSDGKELKWHKDARWALQDCKRVKVVKHIGPHNSGKWLRL